ncbi:PREDICTED: GATA zinc finger domain-containing protein 1 [Tinamus guttatus]|nr:PREDICTED: GATA zinc finger domain-containing protein 1 [Tinamus guttatus]
MAVRDGREGGASAVEASIHRLQLRCNRPVRAAAWGSLECPSSQQCEPFQEYPLHLVSCCGPGATAASASAPQSKQEIHRRSARLRNTKYKSAPAAEKKVSTKGKGRRHIFKLKNPIKAPESVSTIITAESIFYKGVYYQIGDVVSVVDEQDGRTYYAQIRGFIQDQYCEKSAALTWLIPTQASPKDCFDAASYIIGPEEDLPRKMEYLEFVCHAPSEYFKSRSSPFPTVPTRPEKGYIWTHVGPTPAISIKETVTNNL